MAKKSSPQSHESQGDEIKSKTQIKQEMLDLQALGKAIADLPGAVYQSMPVPDSLDEAIKTLARIKNWNAQKRQLQYIGRVMRELSEHEVELLQLALDDYELGRKKLNREFHRLEQLREQLISGDKDCVNSIIAEHPNIDRQAFMQIVRAAQKEYELNTQLSDNAAKNLKHYKKLFQFLKQLAIDKFD